MRAVYHFDGGCRPNPGPIEIAVVHRGISHFRDDLGSGDNNQAEWLALLHAAELAVKHGDGDVLFIGDSTLVVRQASGLSPCRSPHLRLYLERFQTLAADLPRFHLRQVPRTRNLAGIALARRGLP